MNRNHLLELRGKKIFQPAALLFCLLIVCYLPLKPSFGITGTGIRGSGAVLGRVFEFEQRSPIAGATVIARNQDSGYEQMTFTAEDGAFLITSLKSGLYTISAICEEFHENSIADYPIGFSDTIPQEPAEIGLARINEIRTQSKAIQSISQADARTSSRDAEKTGLARTDETRTGIKTIQPNSRSSTGMDAEEAESQLEILVRWSEYTAESPMPAPALNTYANTSNFSLIDLRIYPASTPRQRMPELSSDHILVVAMDEQEVQRDWAIIPDPRIIRAESPNSTGELNGQTLYLSEVEFLVNLPKGLPAGEVRFYSPLWTGTQFSLKLLGTLALR